VIFKDDLDNIVDPEALDYKYFLKDQTKTDLLSLAKLVNLSIESNLRKEELLSFLSVEIPKVLPILIDRLDSKDRLKCEIIVSSGGYMPAWELFTRMKLESRLNRKSSGVSSMRNQEGLDRRLISRQKKYRSQGVDDDEEKDEDVEDYDYFLEHRFPFHSYHNYSYYQPFEQEKHPLSAVFVFPKPLLIDSNYISKKEVKQDRQVYLLIPKEARRYFKTRSLKVDLVASDEIAGEQARPSALETPELLNLIQTLLDNISSKHPKPTPKAGLIPKAIFLPIFKQLVARSQVYKKLHEAEYFDWNDFNELLMGFIYDKRLVKRSIRREGEAERLEVVSSKASEMLSSSKMLNDAFLDWWASGKNSNCHFLFKSKIFEFDSKMPKLKSDEIATRKLLHMQIKNEMKPGTWYFTHSILGKCSIESGGNLFKDRGGYSVSAYGPSGVISDVDEVLEEFLSMMLVFPLCLLGILQTNNSKKELMMLGRWARPSISVDTVIGDPSDMKSANLVTMTSNFEVILQSRSPLGRILAFHLREFCDPITKSDSSGGAITDEPVLVFNLSRDSVLRALRTGNYTWQTIISLLTRAAGSADNIPQNVKHELTVWGGRYGEVEIRTAEVLKCRDEIIAESLMNDPALRRHITSRIGNTTIEIKPGSRSKILSRCDKLGYLTKW
jgi:hypothetical protein